MKPRPVFVVGLARSGTNLLARMLDRHPQICIALDPLMPFFRSLRNAVIRASNSESLKQRFKPELPFQDFYFDPQGPQCLDTLLAGSAELPVEPDELARLRAAVEDRAALESPELARRMKAIEGGTYREVLASALSIIGSTKPDSAWVGCKEVWIFDFIPLLARALPEARFYAIERDPRAILASLLAMAERDPSQAAHPPSYMRHWRKSVALSRKFETDPSLRSRFRTITYESLANAPEPEARRLCAELGIDYRADMLELSADGWQGNSSFASGQDVYGSSAERWRKSLGADVRGAADFLCGPEMALTSYRPDAAPVRTSEVKEYLHRAEQVPASWRSDSGDPDDDFGNEVRRRNLLSQSAATDAGLIRRCFLFIDTFAAIRRATFGEAGIGGKAGTS